LATNTAALALDAERVKTLIASEEEAFRAGRRRSDELWREARRVEPRGVPSSFQDAAPQPIFADRGQGSKIWDVDGNEYVDFHNGFGVMVVGHAHPLIVKAVSERIARGSHFAQPGPDVAAVAGELARRFGQPQWRFTNSGTESTLDAVRLARAFTGRERILKIEASYHGHHDSLMVSVEPDPKLMGPADAPASVPQSEGIPRALVDLVTVVPFNDLPALECVGLACAVADAAEPVDRANPAGPAFDRRQPVDRGHGVLAKAEVDDVHRVVQTDVLRFDLHLSGGPGRQRPPERRRERQEAG